MKRVEFSTNCDVVDEVTEKLKKFNMSYEDLTEFVFEYKETIENIKELANTYRSEPDLKLIILGDLNALPNTRFIESLAYAYDRPMIDAVKAHDKKTATWRDFATRTKSRLDYILYSTGMLCNTGVSAKFTRVDNSTVLKELSDHAILVGGIVLDFA